MRSRDRIARAIVRLYPRAWRERYEGEMLALIEQSGSDWSRVIDLFRGVGREHARAWRQRAFGRHQSFHTSRSLGLRLVLLFWGFGALFVLVAIPVSSVLSQWGIQISYWLALALSIAFRTLLFLRLSLVTRFLSKDPRRARRAAARRPEMRAWLVVGLVVSILEQLGQRVDSQPPGSHPHLVGLMGSQIMLWAVTMQFVPMISRRMIVWQQRRAELTKRRHRANVPQFPLRLS